MGIAISKILNLFSAQQTRVLMLGLDAAGKSERAPHPSLCAHVPARAHEHNANHAS